jgi:acyl-CoA thioesterase-1
MMRWITMMLVTSLCVGAASAQDPGAKKAPAKAAKKATNPVYAPIVDKPGLPRVLIWGDSISIGYTLEVRKALEGVANVHRPPTNCGPSDRGTAEMDQWLGDGKWDVIHFNHGLHDLKYVDADRKNISPDKGKPQIPLPDYEKNLETIVARLKKTGAKLIFATTTPVPSGEPARVAGSEKPYNEAALRVMKKHGVAVNDLHAAIADHPKSADLFTAPGNVHFKPEGSALLAGRVAQAVKDALAAK